MEESIDNERTHSLSTSVRKKMPQHRSPPVVFIELQMLFFASNKGRNEQRSLVNVIIETLEAFHKLQYRLS